MKYVIGIDFGTLSARGVLIQSDGGREVAVADSVYRHGVIDKSLPNGRVLPPDFALQHPCDYIEALTDVISKLLSESGVFADAVVGLGIDFTSSTILPIDKDGNPLCTHAEFEDEPHAYVKLWKHHGALNEADEITALAEKRGESWLSLYGGKVSCEWALPKVLETARKAPRVYSAAHRFIEAGDWISLLLSGEETRSVSFAGYKWLWNAGCGYPCNEFFTELDPILDGFIGEKVPREVAPMNARAGRISKRGAALTGLLEGTAISIPIIDAHAPITALNMTRSGDMILVLGTSGCYMLNSKDGRGIEGIAGCVYDSVIPGLYTYEAGQSSVGDTLDWFVKNAVPKGYYDEAEARGIGIHSLLTEKAELLAPGESGLISLDWFNGNRSVLTDFDLSGAILGLDLHTRPEEIYRAIIEGIAFGTRIILEQYENHGIAVGRVAATGGIAKKNPMMMQIYADVFNREITVRCADEMGARGAAIYAAVAADCYSDVEAAAYAFDSLPALTYKPIGKNAEIYEELYTLYRELHDRFGKESELMHKLRKIKHRGK